MKDPSGAREFADTLGVPAPPSDVLTLEQSTAWGRALGASLPAGTVVALHGELGAGKTTLARAICEGLGVLDLGAVTSPTFALLHEYESARGLVVHADLYRLRTPEELEQLGWDELVKRAAATLVEWPERGGDFLPARTVHLLLEHVPGQLDHRRVRTGRHAQEGA